MIRDNLNMSLLFKKMFEAIPTLHMAHLRIVGTGSFAAHSALGSLYSDLQGFLDTLVEQQQGYTQNLAILPKTLNIVELTTAADCISYLDQLYDVLDETHRSINVTEIQNIIDEVKALINAAKYKLRFLK